MSFIVLDFSAGSTTAAQAGARVAREYGLETVIEYNGLSLNDRQTSLETYRLSEIDGLADADVRDAREANPGRDGELALDAYYGGRTIVLTGKIEAYNLRKLREMQAALKRAFADLTERQLVFRTGDPAYDIAIMCRKIGPIAMREVQSDLNYARDFQVSLRASDPRFYSWLSTTVTLTSDNALLDDVIVNAGSYKSDPTFRLTGPLGASAQIRNRTTGLYMLFPNGVPGGEVWDIDVLNRTVKTTTGANRFKELSFGSDFIELVPGDNIIDFSLPNGGTGSASITYRSAWL